MPFCNEWSRKDVCVLIEVLLFPIPVFEITMWPPTSDFHTQNNWVPLLSLISFLLSKNRIPSHKALILVECVLVNWQTKLKVNPVAKEHSMWYNGYAFPLFSLLSLFFSPFFHFPFFGKAGKLCCTYCLHLKDYI